MGFGVVLATTRRQHHTTLAGLQHLPCNTEQCTLQGAHWRVTCGSRQWGRAFKPFSTGGRSREPYMRQGPGHGQLQARYAVAITHAGAPLAPCRRVAKNQIMFFSCNKNNKAWELRQTYLKAWLESSLLITPLATHDMHHRAIVCLTSDLGSSCINLQRSSTRCHGKQIQFEVLPCMGSTMLTVETWRNLLLLHIQFRSSLESWGEVNFWPACCKYSLSYVGIMGLSADGSIGPADSCQRTSYASIVAASWLVLLYNSTLLVPSITFATHLIIAYPSLQATESWWKQRFTLHS